MISISQWNVSVFTEDSSYERKNFLMTIVFNNDTFVLIRMMPLLSPSFEIGLQCKKGFQKRTKWPWKHISHENISKVPGFDCSKTLCIWYTNLSSFWLKNSKTYKTESADTTSPLRPQMLILVFQLTFMN